MVLWELLTQQQRNARIQVMQGAHYNNGVSYSLLGSIYDLEADEVRTLIEDVDIERRLYSV